MELTFWKGLLIGAGVAVLVFIYMLIKNTSKCSALKKDNTRLKTMVTDRMDIEASGVAELKKQVESLKKENENLRITVQTYAQRPGRKEIEKVNIYQKAVERLMINSPGFGAAWQAALKESEAEFEKIYTGVIPFVKRVIPGSSDAKLIEQDDKN